MTIKSIIFNTAFRNSGTISEPVFILNEGLNDISEYKLKSLRMPLSQPIINDQNNKLYLSTVSSGTLTATIANGNYNITTIDNALETALNNALTSNGNLTITSDTVSNKLVIANTYNTSSSITFTANNLPLTGSASKSAYYELGLIDQLETAQTSFTTANIDMSGINEVNILSNFGNCEINNKYRNVLDSITLEESVLEISNYVNHSNDFLKSNTNSLSYLSIQLLDSRYRPITIDKDFSLNILFKSN
jgi:hypothetical protein